MPQEKTSLLVIGKPTASDETCPAAELALCHGGEMISADSMQTYRGMEIGTAKPIPEEALGVPHYLAGFVEPGRSFSVANYIALAKGTVMDIYNRGYLPVLAGGTGLYVRPLITSTVFIEADNDPALCTELTQRAAQEGIEGLMQKFRSSDPEPADRIEPCSLSRLARAIELCYVTSVTVTEYLRCLHLMSSPHRVCFLYLGFRDRERLYERINQRVDEMFHRELVEEAKELLEMSSGATVVQAVGYKGLLPYFCGEVSLPEAQDIIRRETCRYAKRQLAWLRREE